MEEEWRDVIENNNYMVSNTGKVFSKYSQKEMYLRTNRQGYIFVRLSKDGKKCDRFVHRLMGIAFLENPDNLPEINHKDEIKGNNLLSNLEWVTSKQNNNYGSRRLRQRITAGNEVYQYDMNGNFINKFASTRHAGEQGFHWGLIAQTCRGNQNHHKGFKWSYEKLH
jgi:hypothetical protein